MATIKSIAPCRISICGGGTDTEPYSSTRGGAVVSMAINIRQKFTLFTDDDMWGKENKVPYGGSLDFVYAFRDYYKVNSMHHNQFLSESDGGIEAGIGSSAASAVAIIGALSKEKGETLSRSEIAELAWEIETKKLGMFGGKQDQYASAFGGLNLIEFTNKVTVQPFDRKYAEAIMPSLVLLHTNTTRKSATIQEGFKKLTKKQIQSLDRLKSCVIPTVEAIGEGDIQRLGEILDEAWQLKKESNNVSNREIDAIYLQAKNLGAIGGKLCGAGQSGIMLFVVPPENRGNFIKNMNLESYDFSPCFNGLETRIL